MRSKKTIYNMVSSLILKLMTIINGFIIPKIIITNFGSEVNGLVSSISQFLGYIVLLESGVGPVIKAALYKPLAKKDKKEISSIVHEANKFFRTISRIFILYILVLVVVYPFVINSNFNYIYTISLIIIISVNLFSEYYFGITYSLLLQADQKSYVTSIIQTIVYILNCILIGILAKFNCSIHLIELVIAIMFALRPILQKIYVSKKYGINFEEYDKNYKLKQKWDGLAQHIAAIIHGNADVTILTIMSTLKNVSIYSVYALVTTGVKSIISVITSSVDAPFGDMLARNENNNLNKKFSMYEFIYYTIISIIYSCAIILIVPFVKVYTLGVADVNYIKPLFALMLTISQLIYSIRLPYSSIILAAARFKETRKGAWIEAIINVVLSIILVKKYDLVGVAIATAVAMLIRTVEFISYSNKNILMRKQSKSLIKIILSIFEIFIIYMICNFVSVVNINSYLDWFKHAFATFGISCIIVIPINILFFKNDFKESINVIKNVLGSKKSKKENILEN